MACQPRILRVPALLLALVLTGASFSRSATDAYRPQYHFSPSQNWTNDPNGLVFFEGEYHLFFQYNPFGDKWGHMSWGHAVSRDLLHWKQLPVALPEENGVMIFTGSTVVDTANTSGFCTGGKPCLVAIYTGHTPDHGGSKSLQTQNIAYSLDRGRTWTKYKANPVLDLHMSDFRDPKVLWSEASKRWVMAVALPNEHKVRFYASPNLKQWKAVSEFGPAGAAAGQWECPELFELPVEASGERRWVMKVGLNPGALQGGSGEQYFVGRFDGTKFINDNPAIQTLWTDYGKDCYCALTFNNLPALQPATMIGWMDNWQYAADLPTAPWRGQMTVPRKLGLRKTADGLRLVQEPIDAVAKMRAQQERVSGKDLEAINKELAGRPLPADHMFDLEAKLHLGNSKRGGLRLVSADGSATTIGFDRGSGKVFVDRSKSGKVGFNHDFPAVTRAPLPLANSELDLRILSDRNSLEVFAGGGQVTITNLVFLPEGAQHIEVFSEPVSLENASIEFWSLRAGGK